MFSSTLYKGKRQEVDGKGAMIKKSSELSTPSINDMESLYVANMYWTEGVPPQFLDYKRGPKGHPYLSTWDVDVYLFDSL